MNRFKNPPLKSLLECTQATTYTWQADKTYPGIMHAPVSIGKYVYQLSLAAYQINFKNANTSRIILDGFFSHTDENNYRIYKDRYSLIAHMAYAMDEYNDLSKHYGRIKINGFTFGTTLLAAVHYAPWNMLSRMYKDISAYYTEANQMVKKQVYKYPFTHSGCSFHIHLSEPLSTQCVNDILCGNLDITAI